MAIKRQDKSFDGVLENALGNINEYDIKLGEVRREFSESIVELQSEILLIKEAMEKKSKAPESTKEIYDENKSNIDIDKFYKSDDNDTSTEVSIDTNNGNTEKVQDIKRLFSEGLSAEQISEILQLGKGEVLLIKDLYIR